MNEKHLEAVNEILNSPMPDTESAIFTLEFRLDGRGRHQLKHVSISPFGKRTYELDTDHVEQGYMEDDPLLFALKRLNSFIKR